MLTAAANAFSAVLSPPFRAVLWKSLGATLLLLVLAWFGIQALLAAFVVVPWPWLDTTLAVVAGLGLLIGMVFLIGPITALIAGLFLDEIAGHVEAEHYPYDPPGRDLPLGRSMVESAKFAVLVVIVNAIALVLLLLPGINLVAFLAANGYLLGREFFELAAFRHMPAAEARRLRERNRVRVFLAGLVIAGLVAIPIVNLLAPLFATAFMVHIFKQAERA